MSRWLATNETFRDAHARARAEAENTAVASIVNAAQSGEWRAAAWWLERRRREDWAPQSEIVDVSGVARDLAQQHGIDETELLAEAEKILADVKRHQRQRGSGY